MNRVPVAALAAISLIGSASVFAQGDEGGNVERLYFVNVKEGHGQQFQSGVKEWMSCYAENDGTMPWEVWEAETGTLGRYVFITSGHKFAAFDGEEPADEACATVFAEEFLPHIAHASSDISMYMPDVSHMHDGEYNVAQVISFDVSNARDFASRLGRMSEAAKAQKWPGSYAWYRMMASGEDGIDFYVVILEPDFAGFDRESDYWAMLAKELGQEATDEMYEGLTDNIKESWSTMWSRVEGLDYSPEEGGQGS